MKTLPVILYLAVFCLGAVAQNPVPLNQALKQNLKASGEYYAWSAGPSKVNGSPYLAEEFSPGMIHWNLTWNEGIDLRYNIRQGTFEVRLESGIILIDPLRNNIDTIKHEGEVFVRKYLEAGKEKLVLYLPLLGQQNGYALFKQYIIKFTEAVTDTDLYNKAKPAEYKMQAPVYYVFMDNEYWEVKGSKTLAEIYQMDNKEVKAYLKDNKYKLSNEEDLLEAVLYFSENSLQ